MTVDPATFRSVLGRFASGITIVTAVDEHGDDHGMTVSAFCSASLEPPLIAACIDHAATMHPMLQRVTHFAVNILSAEQEALSRRFAEPEANRFDGVGYTRGAVGAALIDDALAYLECSVQTRFPAGDHTVLIGLVERAIARDARPLLYYRSGYTQLER
jgi:flavin reductase (DIM6/NTAB) family NADH-FMN oxidoreductase RutF